MNFIKKHPRAIVAILLLIMFVLAFLSSAGTRIFGGDAPSDAGIVDEIAHIPAGYSYLVYGDYRLNPEHPPLIKDLAALPLLFIKDLNFPQDLPAWKDEVNGQWEVGWKFIYERGNDPNQIFLYARFLPMLFLFLLGIYVYKWAKELFGVYAGLLAVFLYAFCPNIITHSKFVTTDFGVAVFLFISVYYFTKFIKNPGAPSMFVAAFAFALASLAKFSAILLIPYFALLLLSAIVVRREQIRDFLGSKIFKRQWGKRTWIYIISGILILLIGHAIIAVPYHFHTKNMPIELQHQLVNESIPQQEVLPSKSRDILNKMIDIPGGRSLAQYFLGAVMVFARVGGGNSAFLAGDYKNEGWWYYYIYAFLLKTPITILILSATALVLGFMTFGKNWKKIIPGYEVKYDNRLLKYGKGENRWGKTRTLIEKLFKLLWLRFDIFVMITIIAMFWVAGMKSSANIGLRWMLPIYPFLYVIIAGAVVYCFRRTKNIRSVSGVLKIVFTIVLLAWYVAVNLLIYPHYLSYFNEFIGARTNAYKYLVDSNLDWGQDLNRLAVWADEKGLDKFYIDYFGGGVPARSLGEDRAVVWHSKFGLPSVGEYLVISATFYRMSEFFARRNDEVSYVSMLPREPDEQVGYSLLIYKITDDDHLQFLTQEEAIKKTSDYLQRTLDGLNVETEKLVLTQDFPNTMREYPSNFQRPVYVVRIDDGNSVTQIYVDRLTGKIWGGVSEGVK